MAYHTPERKMTVAEAKKEYKYAQPHAVFCNGERVTKEAEQNKLIFDYMEISHGIVYYFAHKE